MRVAISREVCSELVFGHHNLSNVVIRTLDNCLLLLSIVSVVWDDGGRYNIRVGSEFVLDTISSDC